MLSIRPAPAASTVLCRCCGEPMKRVRTIPKLGGMPALSVFLCDRCSHVETLEQDEAA
jgi:transposase